MDQVDIAPGTHWDSAIEVALRNCTCLVALLSPASVASQNVLDEIGLALDLRKKILPVQLTECDTPLRLRRIQRIPYSGDLPALARDVAEQVSSTTPLISRRNGSPALQETPTPNTPAAPQPPSGITATGPAQKSRRKVVKALKPLSTRSLPNLLRVRNERYLGVKAIDVALSEISADMPGELKRLGIQRDRMAEELDQLEREIAKRSA